MKKEYIKPEAEKMEFNYSETVTASTGNGDQKYDVDDQYYKCPCTTYYAGGWGQNC